MSDVMRIEPAELKAMLHDRGEVAVLDAREEGDFATSHLLLASSVPLSHLERKLAPLVPRLATRIVWMDAGEGFAERAAERSLALGYHSVHVLAGGVEAWRMAGYLLYTGMHVPSKAFAEVVEHDEGTPWISATTLHQQIEENPNLTILDSRSYEEYHANSIPGAMSCPGAELVYRISDIMSSPEAPVVVNCGGRTRSIIGAQSLINAGVSNPVVSMRDGTMAWHLAGYEVASQRQEQPPPVSPEGLAWAQAAAARVAARFEVGQVGAATLAAWQDDSARTTYLVDVRTPEEYAEAHLPGARSVGGGQLVQETDRHLGVWGARVVLTDLDGVRATMTASWLAQMGWEVWVHVGAAERSSASGPEQAPELDTGALGVSTLTPAELAAELGRDQAPLVVDIASSAAYAERHIAGAWFATRARLEFARAELPQRTSVVVTSPDGQMAVLAAHALSQGEVPVRALAGGTEAWIREGRETETGMTALATPPNDLWHTPRGRDPARREDAMREYLVWEVALLYQIKADDDCRFRQFDSR